MDLTTIITLNKGPAALPLLRFQRYEMAIMKNPLRKLAKIFIVAMLGVSYMASTATKNCFAVSRSSPTNSQSQQQGPLQPAAEVVSFSENRLTIRAHAVPLGKILENITRETGVSFLLEGSEGTSVTANFVASDLEVGIRRLIRGLNSVFYYGPSQPGANDIRLTSVHILSSPDSREVFAAKSADNDNLGLISRAISYEKVVEDIDRLAEAAFTDASRIYELARLAEFDENKLRRLAAVEALGKNDSPHFAPLLFNIALKDDAFEVRAAAVKTLGGVLGKAATDFLLQALNDPHPVVRASAVESLASVGDENATDVLMGAMKDKVSLVRVVAVEALSQIGDKKAHPVLIEALGDTDEEVQEYAKKALEAAGVKNPP